MEAFLKNTDFLDQQESLIIDLESYFHIKMAGIEL
jgi:hypothetical protein